jgi:thymidine kinase
MALTLVLGPMASGKTLEMVARLSPLAFTDTAHAVFQ